MRCSKVTSLYHSRFFLVSVLLLYLCRNSSILITVFPPSLIYWIAMPAHGPIPLSLSLPSSFLFCGKLPLFVMLQIHTLSSLAVGSASVCWRQVLSFCNFWEQRLLLRRYSCPCPLPFWPLIIFMYLFVHFLGAMDLVKAFLSPLASFAHLYVCSFCTFGEQWLLLRGSSLPWPLTSWPLPPICMFAVFALLENNGSC